MLFFLGIFVIYILLVLQGIAFYTLIERHLLGVTQNRFGPKKVSLYGLLQPILDGVKLIKKEQLVLLNVSPLVFFGVTVGRFILMFIEFMCLPYYYSFITVYWRYLLVILLVRVNIYFIVAGAIFRKRKFSFLGGVRSAAARVRYEVLFTMNMVIFMLYRKRYTLTFLDNVGLLLLFITFFLSVLVELSRTPFDYRESESDLVSGFNTEYRSVGFVLFFLKEYGRLLFFRLILTNIFYGGYFFFAVLIFSLFIVLRSSLPRYRHDKLMGFMWTVLVFHVARALWATYYLLLV